MNLKLIIKKTRKEIFMKFLTSILMRSLLLIIPYYWSRVINHATLQDYDKAFKLVVVTLILHLLFYLWQHFNNRTWYKFYNKLYLECTNLVTEAKVDDITLGEYTNIINNDIDIIGTFIGNSITRIIQILEFLVIYVYFFSIDFYIFLITIFISIIMLCVILYFSKKIAAENKNRKEDLDIKTINIHNIYDILKKKKKINNNEFIESTINYLNSNTKYNCFVHGVIYSVLAFIQLCRYGIVIYSLYLVSSNTLEIGTVILIYSYYTNIINNFEVLGTINAELQSVKVSISRLNRIISEKTI